MSVAAFAQAEEAESVIRDLDYSLSGLLVGVTEEDLVAAAWTEETTQALKRLRERLWRSEGFPSDGPQTPTD